MEEPSTCCITEQKLRLCWHTFAQAAWNQCWNRWRKKWSEMKTRMCILKTFFFPELSMMKTHPVDEEYGFIKTKSLCMAKTVFTLWIMSSRGDKSLITLYDDPWLFDTQTVVLCQTIFKKQLKIRVTYKIPAPLTSEWIGTFSWEYFNILCVEIWAWWLVPPYEREENPVWCDIRRQQLRTKRGLLMPAIGQHRAAETASKSQWFGEHIKLAYKVLIVPILEWKVCLQLLPSDN